MKELIERAEKMKQTMCRRAGLSEVFVTSIVPIQDVRIKRDGNFTIALVNNTWMGASKRNTCDVDNPIEGESKALHRAIKDMLTGVL